MKKEQVDAIADATGRRYIHPVWHEIGVGFFKQGFRFGYHLANDRTKHLWQPIAMIAFVIGFVVGKIIP